MPDYDVKIKSNGAYWQGVFTDTATGQQIVRSVGAKKKWSKRQAGVRARRMALELGAEAAGVTSTAPKLSAWADTFIASRSRLSLETQALFKLTKRYLIAHFPENPPIDDIMPATAAEWRDALEGGKLGQKQKKPSDSTVCRHVREAKTMFEEALDRELIHRNPFQKLRSTPAKPRKDWRYLTPGEVGKVYEACPSMAWKVLFGLCRFAGLRRGEALSLRWGDVDFAGNRMTVNAHIRKETTKKKVRVVPIEPAKCPSGLTKLLTQAYEAAPEGAVLVCGGELAGLNWNRSGDDIIKKAGLGRYSKTYHTLRKNCETDWAQV